MSHKKPEEFRENGLNSSANGNVKPSKEPLFFQVSDLITLKLKDGNTIIYINGEEFRHCKFLLLEIPLDEIESRKVDEINSIDDAAMTLDQSEMHAALDKSKSRIPPEAEFWGHCSNLQAWVENDYDSRLLHRNLAFSLLKKLSDEGDLLANRVFGEEIVKRLASNHLNVVNFLMLEGYAFYLQLENFKAFVPQLSDSVISLMKEQLFDKFKKCNDNQAGRLPGIKLKQQVFDFLEVLCSKKELKGVQYITYGQEKIFIENDRLIIKKIDDVNELQGFESLIHVKKLKINQVNDIYALLQRLNDFRFFLELEELNLVNNGITDIKYLDCLEYLKILDLSLNQIEEIRGLDNLKSLRSLDISYNKISHIKGLSNLSKLKNLELDINEIDEINGLDNLLDLEVLNLSSNKISEIKNISHLKNLYELNLDNNMIKKIDGLDSFINLRELRLRENKIKKIEGLDNLENLDYLDLAFNEIEKMEGLLGLVNLTGLDLQNNNIAKAEQFMFLEHLEYMCLEDNDTIDPLESITYYENYFEDPDGFWDDNEEYRGS